MSLDVNRKDVQAQKNRRTTNPKWIHGYLQY